MVNPECDNFTGLIHKLLEIYVSYKFINVKCMYSSGPRRIADLHWVDMRHIY